MTLKVTTNGDTTDGTTIYVNGFKVFANALDIRFRPCEPVMYTLTSYLDGTDGKTLDTSGEQTTEFYGCSKEEHDFLLSFRSLPKGEEAIEALRRVVDYRSELEDMWGSTDKNFTGKHIMEVLDVCLKGVDMDPNGEFNQAWHDRKKAKKHK